MHISLDSALGRQRRLNSVGESVLQIAPNAAAAYSLRSLTGGDPKVVRVRRASDNGERDFTSSEITSGEMVSWVNRQVIAPLDIQALEADGRTGDFLIAKAAYSLRSLGTRQATLAATGDTVARADGKFVVQVRRSSDDALKSFTAAEVTDGTLLSFVGTSGSDNGFVKTWYDQSVTNEAGDTATGNHAVQATAGSQPKIVNAGSLLNELDFDGTDDALDIDFGADLSQANSLFMVHQADSTGSSANEFFDRSGGSGDRTLLDQASSDYRMLSPSSAGTGLAVTTDRTLVFALYNGSSSLLAKNGTVSSAVNPGTQGINQNSSLGSSASGTRFYDGSMQEFIVYNSDQTGNRTAIEANIGEAYSITGIPAYDDEVDGFVETWYDQSGNVPANDAVQPTAGNQPKIVGEITSGQPHGLLDGLEFDGTDDNFELTSVLGMTSAGAIFSVAESGGGNDKLILDNRDSGVDGFRLMRFNDELQYRWQSATVATSANPGTNTKFIAFANHDGSNASAAVNGATATTTSDTSSISVAAKPHIGARSFSSASNFWDGTINELIIYNSDQNANRSALQTNINSHYSIF